MRKLSEGSKEPSKAQQLDSKEPTKAQQVDANAGVRSALWKELKMMGLEQYELQLHDLGVRSYPSRETGIPY